MQLKLSRIHLFLLGIITISFFFLRNEANYLLNGEFAEGTILDPKELVIDKIIYEYHINYTYVSFEYKSKVYVFNAGTNLELPPSVRVLFLKKDPNQARVYSFFGFFFEDIVYALLAILGLAAIVFSFISADSRLTLSLFRSKPKSNTDLPERL